MTSSGPGRIAPAAEVRASRPSGRITAKDNLVRSLVCAARGVERTSGDAEQIMRQLYPNDEHSAVVLRAAVSPGTLDAAGWSAIAASTATADFVANLGPLSAASALIRGALNLDISGGKSVIVPGIAAAASGMSFVGEAEPAPVRELVLSGGVTLTPFKIMGLTVISRELAKSTNAEPIIRTLMAESAALALDAALLSATVADTTRPAGLLLGATAAGTGGSMAEDLAALVGTIAPVAGQSITIVAAPDAYARIRIAQPQLPWPVLPSAALAAGTVAAFATNALAFAVDALPEIDASNEATAHMSTVPLPIVSGANADPVRSAWQTASVVLRLILTASWGWRVPVAGAAATTSSAGW